MNKIRGFTIVEVLVALIVLSVGILGSLSIFASVTRTFTAGQTSVEAAANAAAMLEAVRGDGCRRSTASAGNGGSAAYTWIVDEISPELRRVTVIAHSVGLRARTDTFSVFVAC